MSLSTLDAATVVFTKMCRDSSCPLLGGATPVERPECCPVGGRCDQAGLAAWTVAFQSAAVEVMGDTPATREATGTGDGTGAMLMDIKEVSALLGISVSSIQRLVRAQSFPQPVRMLGSLVRWRRADILAFASGTPSQRNPSPAPQEQEERRPRRGRPKGSKNRRTLEKEAWRSAYGPGRAGNQ
ncbi:MAG: helix-turn-helix domain-containing protein [Desulfovibrio sp.]|nr:helix-turn-helix domain-containing protein [Desulfovibrio sp.]